MNPSLESIVRQHLDRRAALTYKIRYITMDGDNISLVIKPSDLVARFNVQVDLAQSSMQNLLVMDGKLDIAKRRLETARAQSAKALVNMTNLLGGLEDLVGEMVGHFEAKMSLRGKLKWSPPEMISSPPELYINTTRPSMFPNSTWRSRLKETGIPIVLR